MPKKPSKKTLKGAVRQAKQSRSKATVDAILEAAARILAEDGWAGVNTNAIAARAGVSIGSVYEYFPNKHAILDAIIDRHLSAGEAMLAEAAANLPDPLDTDDVVDALIEGFVRLHRDDPRLHRALSSEAPVSSACRARIEALRGEIISLVEMALPDHGEAARVKATLLVDVADVLAHRWIVDEAGLPVEEERMTREASRMLKGYLASRA